MTATQAATQWAVRGTVLIACNCDYGCSCNFNARPTAGTCEGNWNWHVEHGSFGDTPLDGVTFSVAVNWPGAIHEGDGEALVAIDERASEPQRHAILTLIGGGAGGPWAIISKTISKVNGPKYVPYELHLGEHHTTMRAGDCIRLEMEPIRNPVTNAESFPRAILPQGFVFKEGSFASSKVFAVHDGIDFEHPGKYTAFAPFEYQGP